MKKVILDTNFLMIPAQSKVDVFAEIKKLVEEPVKFCVPSSVVDELIKLSIWAGKDSRSAMAALQLMEQRNIEKVETELRADDAIVRLAGKDTIVCTQDRELRDRVKKRKSGVIMLKQKKYLAFA